jgi:hypothetical protein
MHLGRAGYALHMAKNHGPTVKSDKQYEGLRKRGASKEKAARIANANAGSGNQASKRGGKAGTYEERTKDDLLQEARKVGIEGRSKMSKNQLASALRNH